MTTRARRARKAALPALAVAAMVGGAFPAAAAAQADDASLTLSLRLGIAGQKPNFMGDLQYGCMLFFSDREVPGGRSRWVYAQMKDTPAGALDFGARRGEARLRGRSWQVEALPPSRARPARFADLGLRLAGRKVFLTARVTTGRRLLAAARRSRIAQVRGAKVTHGPLVDRRRQPVAGTFSSLVTGTLTMLPAMSRAIERTRCRGPKNRASRRLPSGYALGRFFAELRPDRASGLTGAAVITPSLIDPLAAEPTGGATPEGSGFLMPITTGLPVPLRCFVGTECVPGGGAFGLGGGLDLVHEGRRMALGGLSVSTAGARQTVSGTVDGSAAVLAEGEPESGRLPFVPGFVEQLRARFGVEVSGGLRVETRLDRIGPA